MKLIKNIFFPLVLLLLMFTACERENIDNSGQTEVDPSEISTNPLIGRTTTSSGVGLDLDCFVINYSFSFVDSEGIEHEVTSDEDLETLFSDEALIIVDFVYPLNVTQDGVESSVEDGEALAELFTSCVPDGGWEDGEFPAYVISLENSCLEHIYPLTLNDTEGNEVVVNNEDEYEEAILEEPLVFVFPLTLLDNESGEEIVVNDIDELFDALFACNGFELGDSVWNWETGFEYIGCYMVEFPITVIVDGEEVIVENHEEFCELMIQGDIVDFAYPLNLTDVEGNTIVVNNAEELEAALEACGWIVIGGEEGFLELLILQSGAVSQDEGGAGCYEIQFPISVTLTDGTTLEFNSMDDIDSIWNMPEEIELVNYPVTVTLNEDGSEVEIGNLEENIEILENCQ